MFACKTVKENPRTAKRDDEGPYGTIQDHMWPYSELVSEKVTSREAIALKLHGY